MFTQTILLTILIMVCVDIRKTSLPFIILDEFACYKIKEDESVKSTQSFTLSSYNKIAYCYIIK